MGKANKLREAAGGRMVRRRKGENQEERTPCRAEAP